MIPPRPARSQIFSVSTSRAASGYLQLPSNDSRPKVHPVRFLRAVRLKTPPGLIIQRHPQRRYGLMPAPGTHGRDLSGSPGATRMHSTHGFPINRAHLLHQRRPWTWTRHWRGRLRLMATLLKEIAKQLFIPVDGQSCLGVLRKLQLSNQPGPLAGDARLVLTSEPGPPPGGRGPTRTA